MTFPTIPTVGAGRVLTTNQADTSQTRTFPSLSSLTKNSGDLLIAICIGYQSSTTNAQFGSWGGGFTEFHDSGTSTTLAIGMAYKISDGTETGTFTVTQSSTVTGHASMVLLSIPGAHWSTAPEAGSRADGTSAAADPASFDPSGWAAEDTLWISVVASGMTSGTGSWTGTGTTAPTNYSDRVDSNTTDSSTVGQTEVAVAFRQNNASSEDAGTAGVDTSNARNSAIVIAIRPRTIVTVSAPLLTHSYSPQAPKISASVGSPALTHTYSPLTAKLSLSIPATLLTHSYVGRAPQINIVSGTLPMQFNNYLFIKGGDGLGFSERRR